MRGNRLNRAQKVAMLKVLQTGSMTAEEGKELANTLGIERQEIQLIFAGSQEEARQIYKEIGDEAQRRGLKPRTETKT